PLHPDEPDRERAQHPGRTDLDVGRELRKAALAEQARGHVGVAAPVAARAEDHAAVPEGLEKRLARDARGVAVGHGDRARPPPDLVRPSDPLDHGAPPRTGRKYAISRIEPVRSATGFHTASTAIPTRTSCGSTSPSTCRNPPLEPSIAITAGISGVSSGFMSQLT